MKSKKNSIKWTLLLCLMIFQIVIDTIMKPVNAAGLSIPGILEGIGYREPDLQVPKTSFFISEEPQGIPYASFSGGTNIFIKSYQFNEDPQTNKIMLYSLDLNSFFYAPILSEDDAFNSHPMLGFITYRLPSLSTLIGVPDSKLAQYSIMTFTLHIQTLDSDLNNPYHLTCPQSSIKCNIKFYRAYTPLFYYLQPPVVYYQSITSVIFDPKSTQNLNIDLPQETKPFTNSKIGGFQIDFSDYVDETTYFQPYHFPNAAMGKVGQVPPNQSLPVSFLWEDGYSQILEQQATFCSYDNSSCYMTKVVPVIFGLSYNTGYVTGGQNLSIQGFGFMGGNISVSVAGLPCNVSFFTNTQINCQVSPSSSVSNINGSFLGSNGMRRTMFNGTLQNQVNFNNLIMSNPSNLTISKMLTLQLETPLNQGLYQGSILQGWFMPPTTTSYRFYMTCDDLCMLKIGNSSNSTSNLTTLLSLTIWNNYRDYWKNNDNQKRISDWVNLTQGEPYYIEANHIQQTGNDHLTVAVEIQQNQTVGHLHSMKEIQQLTIQQTNVFDQISISIKNPDSGTYVIIFQNPSSLLYTKSSPIPANANTDTFYMAVYSYYSTTFGSNINIKLQMFDINSNPTTNKTNATQYLYYITMLRIITGKSSSNLIIQKISTLSTISSSYISQSSSSLGGNFIIQCSDPTGKKYKTQSIIYNEYYSSIQQKIMQGCPYLLDKIVVSDASTTYGYNENGRNLYVRFVGINQQPGYLNILSDNVRPLTGNNITFLNSSIQPYSTNLFYEPIPFEMLYTYEQQPQVIVNVGDLPATCHNLTCNYAYIQNSGQVQSFSFDEATSLLTLNGINLPKNVSMIQQINFALSHCNLDSSAKISSTKIECYLAQNATCGSFIPNLYSVLGYIANSASLTSMQLPCFVSSISPNKYLNLIGGDNITFTGQYFPTNLTTSNVSIIFSDTQQTQCIPIKSNYQYLSCITNEFDQTASLGQSYSVLITINGYIIQSSLTILMNNYTALGSNLIPNSLSPVLKQQIILQLSSNFRYILNKSDFSAMIINSQNSSKFNMMNIISANNTAKTLTFMYGGAWSGIYNLRLIHNQYGLINTKGLLITVGSNITQISPNVGSIYGGSLITITGTNYGTQTTDNPVQISYNGGVDSTNCYIKTTNSTSITCLVDNTINNTDGQIGTVVVFLKLSEESICQLPNQCQFTFTQNVPTVSSLSVTFDTVSLQYQVIISGIDFSGDISSVYLLSEGITQPISSITSTQAIFQIQNISASQGLIDQMNLYFPIGTPANHTIITQPYQLTPQLVSITPNNGSIAGSVIIANIQGIGIGTTGLNLVDQAGVAICQYVNITQYGQVICQTFAKEISAQILRISLNNSIFTCANPSSIYCQYQQLSSDFYPQVTSILINNPTATLNGQNFITSNFAANVQLAGVYADSVVILSSNQILATWNMGIPPLISALAPIVTFVNQLSKVQHFAKVLANISNPLQVTQSTQGLQCSYAGGCLFQISSPGLSTLLSQNQYKNYLSICQNVCQFQKQLSNQSVATCLLSSMSTEYSNTNFMIQQTQQLNSGQYFGTGKGYINAFDGSINVPNNDSSANCTVGMQFKSGYVAILSQVKFFLSASDTTNFRNGNLVFQGSMDGVTYTSIYTVDNNVHGGWNYQTWNSTLQNGPQYRFYRYFGKVAGSCLINEIVFTGVETIQDLNTSYYCTPQLYINGNVSTQSFGQITYNGSITPLLTSISPRYGNVEGGENISFVGTGFSNNIADYSVIIDGINCPVFQATSTLIQCISGPRPGLVNSSLQITIANKGQVSLQGLIFQYVSYWSSDSTWGGEFQPMEGESVNIPPGLNLFVDVDSTPILNLVLVQGSLIFAPHSDPNHQRNFDARYIFVNGGYMEVGTETFPYTSKLTITMHGQLSDPYIPIYGNKCIGLRYATLEMHGPVRQPTWTVLQQTAYQNQSKITLNEAVDWQIGEQIVIASTDYDMNHAETFYIQSIDRTNINNPVITLDSQLLFTHFAKTENYGGVDFDIRAEVGLLSRNVVYKGDPETSSANMYGAIIFMHSQGDDSIIGKISYIELRDVGQAFKVGRYPIHFHMVGNIMQSYATGNSIHDSNNRAITIHGVHYLRVIENVAYNIKGHSIFIEDAIESRNFIQNNLVINTHRSWSLLNTDTTPANFWITFPDNDFIGNHAAGSENYGFWFDAKDFSTGPSASTDVCPKRSQAGLFINNTAHSMGRYGLRVFHEMTPFTYPCMSTIYDSNYTLNNQTDPYWQNPPILTNFDNFTGWKCGRNGAIAERMGNVHWNNFKTADNLVAGIEFSLTDQVSDNMAQIYNATVVGRTNNSEQIMFYLSGVSMIMGIITPRTENFTVDSAKFYNFDWNGSAALSGCSHCFFTASTDSGARTVTFKNTYFDQTVKQKIIQQQPYRHIYYDVDGTLTGKGPNTYYTNGWKHNQQPECDYLPDIYDGVVCNSSVQVRRLAFWNWLPQGIFMGQNMSILQWDDNILANNNLTQYLDSKNYSIVPFKDKLLPTLSWAVPFVTGHKYKINWGDTGLDWNQMEVDLSERWRENDLNIMLMHNFSLVRSAINVTVDGVQFINNTLPTLNVKSPLLQTGQNLVLNDSTLNKNLPASIQTQFITVFNGKNMKGIEKQVIWNAIQCVGACNEVVKVVPVGNITYWSNASSWTNRNKTIPKDGDSVVIESGWNMVLDINTPNLTKITINGRLTFINTTNITMSAQTIFVYAGELIIGSKDYPYQYNAKIILVGGRFTAPFAFDGSVDGGNKILANVGTIKMFGIQRKYLFRLQQPAIFGANQFYVDTGLDLIQGDQLGLLPTSYQYSASDQVFVQQYNKLSGLVIINSTLNHYHWGANMSTASKYNGVDIRGEVILLTRNIQIIGQNFDGWGGQVVTSSTLDQNMNIYNGNTIMDSVEIYDCSQNNTLRAAVRFDGNSGSYSSITNSSIHDGAAWGVQIINSRNIYISNTVIFGFRQMGANLQTVKNITIKYSVVANIRDALITNISMSSNEIIDQRAGITVCGYIWPLDYCTDVFINNNIVAGTAYAGYVNMAQNCGDTSQDKFFNNIAHSIKGAYGGNGIQYYADTSTDQTHSCYQGSSFIAYKCWQQGAFSYDDGLMVIFKNMTMIDNVQGLGMSMGNATNGSTYLIFNDNYIFGESEIPDCPDNKTSDYCFIVDKQGVYPGQISKSGQNVMQSQQSHLPVYDNHFDTVNSASRIIWNRNKFFNFKGQTALGAQQSIIGFSIYSPDYTPMHEFYDTQFTDIEDSAMANLISPPAYWANIEDCGNFPCTGPYNLLYTFRNSTWYGQTINNPYNNFQIIPNNPGLSPYIQNCQYKQKWNGYLCSQESISILLFQSLDLDGLDRAYQPINITQQGTKIKNVLNAGMDHGWDGFYTTHKRVPLFPALIDAPLGSVYNITYTSTPPQNQQFTLNSIIKNTGVTIRIAYPEAVSYAVYINGGLIEMNQWSSILNQYSPIKQKYCGENRYIGVQNILEFFISGNCTLQIKPRDAIQSMVRMEWTMRQFYASGGTTTFADRLCSVLGIHASQMKVVSVYEGSLIINYNIIQASDSSKSLAQLSQLQTQVFATGSVDLGAPILDASSTLSSGNTTGKQQSIIKNGVVTAGGYTPVSIASQSSNQAMQAKGVYIPDVPIIQQQQTIIRNVSVQITSQQNSSQAYTGIANESQNNGNSNSWIAIPIVIGIFFIIVILVGVKWFLNMKKVKESELLAIKAAQLRQQELSLYNTAQKLKGCEVSFDENSKDELPDKTIQKQQKFQQVARNSEVEEYIQQYDPNNDFAIFGIGDKTKGGIQNLKEKMNIADIVENEEMSSEDEDEQQVQPNHKTQNISLSGSNQNSDSPQNTDGNSKSNPTSSQNERLPNPQSEQNNMPEFQEIYEL